MMYTVDYDNREVLAYLGRLAGRLDNLKPALADIGEYVTETTKRRFDTSTGPDGQRWAPNTQVTIDRYLDYYKSSRKKDGSLSAKGAARSASKKPLIGETRSLMSTIHYLVSDTAVAIGSPMEYSAVQQFGADKGSLGSGAPWGDIPPRPFLGISAADEAAILDIVGAYLSA